MENLGAKRLLDREIRFNLLVPCYEVNGVLLIHSGTDFVIHKCTPFSMKVMKLAKFKLGKRQNDIINLDEIRSLYGLLLFSLLLENKFNENTLRKIFNETYKKVLKKYAEPGDFIFLDPPYFQVTEREIFLRYTSDRFYEPDQEELAEIVNELYDMGCEVMMTNSNHPRIYDLYNRFDIKMVQVRRSVNCKGNGRSGEDTIITAFH